MLRIAFVCLFFWSTLVFPAFAGEIEKIAVVRQTDEEIEVLIEGEYESYRAFTVSSSAPFRYVIDFEGSSLKAGHPKEIKVKGPIVSKIRTGERKWGLRVVLDSARGLKPFYCDLQEKKDFLLLKCSLEREEEKPFARSPEKDLAPAGIPEKSEKTTKERPTELAREVPPQKETPKAPLVKPIKEEPSEVEVEDVPAPVIPEKRVKNLEELFGPVKKESTEKKEAEEKVATYTGQKVSLDFYKTDIHNVFRLFSEISGKNIIVDESVEGEITLELREVPWDFALDLILDLKKLRKQERLNTLIITPRPEKTEGNEGELVIHKVPRKALQPARLLKQKKENRQHAQSLVLKAHGLEKEGKRKEALGLYEQAVKLWGDNTDLIKKVSYLHYVSGNFSKSYYYAGEALKLNPNDAEAALYAALPAVRMDKRQAARFLFDKAINGEPKIPEAFYDYGLFLEKQGDKAHALSMYLRYEELFGPSLEVSMAIARAYEAQGMKEKACERYKEIRVSGLPLDKGSERKVITKIKSLCPSPAAKATR